MKARYFGYIDQIGKWVELSEPITNEMKKTYREIEVFYRADDVEKKVSILNSMCDQIEKCSNHLPEFFVKFYFDIKRRCIR